MLQVTQNWIFGGFEFTSVIAMIYLRKALCSTCYAASCIKNWIVTMSYFQHCVQRAKDALQDLHKCFSIIFLYVYKAKVAVVT